MTAAMKKIATIMIFRPFASHSAFNTPRAVSTTVTTGISNTMPKIRKTVSKNEI